MIVHGDPTALFGCGPRLSATSPTTAGAENAERIEEACHDRAADEGISAVSPGAVALLMAHQR